MSPIIQYTSGLYNAIRTGIKYTNLIVPKAPYLALCGDIATTECKSSLEFLSWCSTNFEKVIWIPGWYEMGGYKGKTRLMTSQLDAMYQLVQTHDLLNIVIGNKTELYMKDMLILATPLFIINPSPLCNPELHTISKKVVSYGIASERHPAIIPVTVQELERMYRSEYDWILKKAYYHKLHGNNMPIIVISGSMTHLLGCEPNIHMPGIYNIIKDSHVCLNLHGADFGKCDGGNICGYAEDNVWYGVNDYRYINYDPRRAVGVQPRNMM